MHGYFLQRISIAIIRLAFRDGRFAGITLAFVSSVRFPKNAVAILAYPFCGSVTVHSRSAHCDILHDAGGWNDQAGRVVRCSHQDHGSSFAGACGWLVTNNRE